MDIVCEVRSRVPLSIEDRQRPLSERLEPLTEGDSIFAISLGAYMGASSSLLAATAGRETWAALRLARDAFGEECQRSPSLSVMADSIKATLSNVEMHRL